MVKYLDNAASDGSSFGQSTTDLISLYGKTPIVQPAATAQSAVATSAITAAPTATPIVSGYSFSTTTQMQALVTALNDLITRVEAMRALQHQTRLDLIAFGVQKGSA